MSENSIPTNHEVSDFDRPMLGCSEKASAECSLPDINTRTVTSVSKLAPEGDSLSPVMEDSAFAEAANNFRRDGPPLAGVAKTGLSLVQATATEEGEASATVPAQTSRSPLPNRERTSLAARSTETAQSGNATEYFPPRHGQAPGSPAPVRLSGQWTPANKMPLPPIRLLNEGVETARMDISSTATPTSPMGVRNQNISPPIGVACMPPGGRVSGVCAVTVSNPQLSSEGDRRRHIPVSGAACQISHGVEYRYEGWPLDLPQHLMERLIKVSGNGSPKPETFMDSNQKYHCPFCAVRTWTRLRWFVRHLLESH